MCVFEDYATDCSGVCKRAGPRSMVAEIAVVVREPARCALRGTRPAPYIAERSRLVFITAVTGVRGAAPE